MTRCRDLKIGGALLCACLAVVLVSAACAQSTSRDDSLEALTIAVKNNPDLELMATDEQAKILTVRVKSVDRVITVTPDDLEDGRLVIDVAGLSDSPPAAEGDGEPAAGAASGAGVSASRDDKQAAVKSSAGGVSVEARSQGKQADVKPSAGGVSLDARSGGKQADVKTSAEGISVDAGGKKVAIDTATGGVSVAAPDRSASVRTEAEESTESEPPTTEAAPVPDPAPAPPPAAADAAPAAPATEASASRRRRDSPIDCGSRQKLTFDNIVLEATEAAVRAIGNCHVVLTNSEIIGGEYAVRASGGARIELVDTIVRGGKAAVRVSGRGVVSAHNSELDGGVKTSGQGSFEDLGGNRIR